MDASSQTLHYGMVLHASSPLDGWHRPDLSWDRDIVRIFVPVCRTQGPSVAEQLEFSPPSHSFQCYSLPACCLKMLYTLSLFPLVQLGPNFIVYSMRAFACSDTQFIIIYIFPPLKSLYVPRN